MAKDFIEPEVCELDERQHKPNVPSFFLTVEELEESFEKNVLSVIRKILDKKK